MVKAHNNEPNTLHFHDATEVKPMDEAIQIIAWNCFIWNCTYSAWGISWRSGKSTQIRIHLRHVGFYKLFGFSFQTSRSSCTKNATWCRSAVAPGGRRSHSKSADLNVHCRRAYALYTRSHTSLSYLWKTNQYFVRQFWDAGTSTMAAPSKRQLEVR